MSDKPKKKITWKQWQRRTMLIILAVVAVFVALYFAVYRQPQPLMEMDCMVGTDAPAALVEVSVYGGAEPDAYDALTARVCELLDAVLDIDPARVYVKYAETPNWGWNGGNF